MAYIGNQADTAFTSLIKQDLTGASGTSLTLTHAVANANDIALYINNVRQEPVSAYSTNGTAVSLTGSVVSSDDIYVLYLARAVQTTVPPDGSVSTAKIASSAVDLTSKVTGVLPVANGGTGATSFAEANSVIETWYYDSTNNVHNNGDLLYRGYTRLTTNNTANKNGGMTHASTAGTNGTGIWTFPSTGIWRIELTSNLYHTGGADSSSGIFMEVTTDNSTYNSVTSSRSSGTGTNYYMSHVVPYVLNVDNVSNVKFRHKITSNAGLMIRGGGDVWSTKINFIKLCPSV